MQDLKAGSLFQAVIKNFEHLTSVFIYDKPHLSIIKLV